MSNINYLPKPKRTKERQEIDRKTVAKGRERNKKEIERGRKRNEEGERKGKARDIFNIMNKISI
jgi:hypothetical protein